MGNRRDSSTLSRFHLGDLHVHPDRMVVVKDGVDIPLEPLWMEILVVLAQKACSADETDRTVSTSELMLEVWKTDRYTDNPVTKAISGLRKAIGDDTHNPRYIKTIHRRGYRVIAPVLLPDGYLRLSNPADIWRHGNPYVGLAAFDAEHADVFVGRNNVTAKLLDAMSAQIDNELRFVLLVGASGCGKTSLLRAGALPRLTSEKRASPLHSISVADCDLSAITDGDLLMPLASALCAWSLPGGQVFSMQTPGSLKERMSEAPEAIPTLLTQVFQRHPMRDLEANPHAHLLLIVDHAEALVSTPRSPDALAAFEHALCALCETPRVLVMMVARSDYYPQLVQALPALTARKAGGHIDLLAPNRGEISEIIRRPAELASLQFETGESRLDDALRDAAVGQPDALPLLQHTLHALYERRTEQGTLTWDAYRSIGGLEGAIAHHAEQVFSALPAQAQAALDTVLGRLVVHGTDNDAVTARRVRRDSLSDDANTLVDAFIAGRLFVATLQDGHPHVGVAHEALLRQWPRAREWAEENLHLLMAKARLQQATDRWEADFRNADQLLNPGRPLEEGKEVQKKFAKEIRICDREFLEASYRAGRKTIFLKRIAISTMFVLTIASMSLAISTSRAMKSAEHNRQQALDLVGYMLVELADQLRPTASTRAMDSLSLQALEFLEAQTSRNASENDLINYSRALRTRGEVMSKKGLDTEANKLFERATKISFSATEKYPESLEAIFEAGQIAYWRGYQAYKKSNLMIAREEWNNYLLFSNNLILKEPANPRWLMENAFADANLGAVDLSEHDCKNAQRRFIPAIRKIQRAESSISPPKESWSVDRLVAMSWSTRCSTETENLETTSKAYSFQISQLREIIKKRPDAIEWEQQLASLLHLDAVVLTNLGKTDDAEELISESIDRLRTITKFHPTDPSWNTLLASALAKGAEIANLEGRSEVAILRIKNAIQINEAINKKYHDEKWERRNTSYKFYRAIYMPNEQGKLLMEIELNNFIKLHNQHPDNKSIKLELVKAITRLASNLIAQGKTKEAHDLVKKFEEKIKVCTPESISDYGRSKFEYFPVFVEYNFLANNSIDIQNELKYLKQSSYAHPNFMKIISAERQPQNKTETNNCHQN